MTVYTIATMMHAYYVNTGTGIIIHMHILLILINNYI